MQHAEGHIVKFIEKTYERYTGDIDVNNLPDIGNFLAPACKIIFDNKELSVDAARKLEQEKCKQLKYIKVNIINIFTLNKEVGYYLILSNWLLKTINDEEMTAPKMEVYKIVNNQITELFGLMDTN